MYLYVVCFNGLFFFFFSSVLCVIYLYIYFNIFTEEYNSWLLWTTPDREIRKHTRQRVSSLYFHFTHESVVGFVFGWFYAAVKFRFTVIHLDDCKSKWKLALFSLCSGIFGRHTLYYYYYTVQTIKLL